MSGIIGQVGTKSGVLDTYPQGTIFYTDSVEYTSTGATQNMSSNGDTYVSSNLAISVPANIARKCSKIWVMCTNQVHMNANVRGGDFLAYFQWDLVRTAPGSTTIITNFERCGSAADINVTASGLTAAIGLAEGTLSGWDKNITNAVHTYKLRLAKLNQESVYGGNAMSVYGHSGNQCNIAVCGIAK